MSTFNLALSYADRAGTLEGALTGLVAEIRRARDLDTVRESYCYRAAMEALADARKPVGDAHGRAVEIGEVAA